MKNQEKEQVFISELKELMECDQDSSLTFSDELEQLEEWDSLVALSFIALAKASYGMDINGDQIRSARSVEDLFKLVTA